MKKTLYSIYHLPNYVWTGIHKGKIGKIGCSKNGLGRPTSQMKEGDTFEILEQHTCIEKASDREIELQEQYGYPVDKKRYSDIQGFIKKGNSPEARGKAITNTDFKTKTENTDWSNMADLYSVAILQYLKDGTFIKEWKSLSEASRSLNIPASNMCSCLKGRYKTAGGFVWRYKKE
jgi:hypothetical protein